MGRIVEGVKEMGKRQVGKGELCFFLILILGMNLFQNGEWSSFKTSASLQVFAATQEVVSPVKISDEEQWNLQEVDREVIGIDLVHEETAVQETVRLDLSEPEVKAMQTFAVAIQTDRAVRLQTGVDDSLLSEEERLIFEHLQVEVTSLATNELVYTGSLMELIHFPLLQDLPATIEGETVVGMTMEVYLPSYVTNRTSLDSLETHFSWAMIEVE